MPYRLVNADSPRPPDQVPPASNLREYAQAVGRLVLTYLKALAVYLNGQLSAIRQVPDWYRFNAELTGTKDGANTTFRYPARVRFDPDMRPQAFLMQGSPPVFLVYVPGAPAAGQWTVVNTVPTPTDLVAQDIIVGTAPAPGEFLAFGLVIIQ